MTSRSRELRTRAVLRTVLLGLVLAAAALVSSSHFLRADLTERREYTISDSTRRMLGNLPDVVTVTVYLSTDLPQHMAGFRTRFMDLLDEYRAYGGDRLRVRVVDPASDPETEQQVQLLGIYPVQLQSLERDRAEVMNAYLGITVRYRDKQEVIPLVVGLERLEYDLTGAILKVLAERQPVVGFLTVTPSTAPGSDYGALTDELRKSYEVRQLSEANADALEDLTTLVVLGSDDLPDDQLYAIDQFIMRGGKAFFVIDGVDLSSTGLRATAARGNLRDFVSSYGATVKADIVVDRVSGSATFQSGFMTMTLPYPFWPKVTPPNLSLDNPVVSQLDAVTFPWTSSITLGDSLPGSVTAEVLARSSGYSWTVPPQTDLNPRQNLSPAGPDAAEIAAGRGPGYVLAVALTGTFGSAFAQGPPPAAPGVGGEPAPGELKLSESEPTQMIVVADSRMFQNGLIRQLPPDAVFFLNAVDWLTLGDALIGIRSRAVEDRPLKTVSDTTRATTKSVGTFAVPIGVIVFGLGRSIAGRRRRSRARSRSISDAS